MINFGTIMTIDEISILITKHSKSLMNFSLNKTGFNKVEAEDLYQETIFKLLKNHDKYNPSKAAFTTYAFRVMTNLAIDRNRSMKNKAHSSWNVIYVDEYKLKDEEIISLDFLLGETHNEGESKINSEFILTVISSLPPKIQSVMFWRIQGYDYDSIAEGLNMNVNNVKSNLFRGRKSLQKALLLESQID